MKRVGFLALVLALLLVCGSVFATESDPAVIKLGDNAILLSEAQAYFDSLYAQYSAFYTTYGQNIPAEEVQQILDETISELSLLILLDQKAAEYGFNLTTEDEREALWNESTAIYEESIRAEADERGVTIDQVRQERTDFGMTPELQYNSILEVLPYTRLYNEITKDVTVDNTSIQKAYDSYVQQDKELYANDVMQYEFNLNYANVSALYRPEGYRAVNHILLPIPEALSFEIQNAQSDLLELDDAISALEEELKSIENGTSASRTADQVKAEIEQKQQEYDAQNQVCETAKEQILPQIQSTIEEINAKLSAGESFASLSLQYGRDDNFPTQDDGTCYVHNESVLFDKSFQNAAMSLSNIGDYAMAVSDHGVYIVQYVGDVEGGAVPMSDDVAQSLQSMLLEDTKNAYYDEMVKQWQQQNPVETNPELIIVPDLAALPMEETPDGTVANPAEADGSIG